MDATDTPISARATNKLNDRKIKAFIDKASPGRKLADGGGMFLILTAARAPLWRIKYRLAGKEGLYSIGVYPEISLEAARAERTRVKDQLRRGRNPVQERRVERAKETTASFDTFSGAASAWLEENGKRWSAVHYRKSKRALERDVFPRLGNLPVAQIEPVMVTNMVKSILSRGVRETAAKILQHVTDIFEYARAHGLRGDNPATPAQTVLPASEAPKGRPAFLTWPELGGVLRGAEAAHLSPAVRLAHRLCAFSATRISNVVEAEWPEFHLDDETPMWVVPRRKMKAKDRHHDHKVILGSTIAAELRSWCETKGGKGYVFPSPQGGKHITREALEKAYRETLGLADKHSPHGWRSAFSTLARDNGFERDAVELVLDHVHDSDVVRAYDRGERLEQRKKLMAWWDVQLTQAQRGADVVSLAKRKA
jgi:integrase